MGAELQEILGENLYREMMASWDKKYLLKNPELLTMTDAELQGELDIINKSHDLPLYEKATGNELDWFWPQESKWACSQLQDRRSAIRSVRSMRRKLGVADVS
jgi:hypothetical protein